MNTRSIVTIILGFALLLAACSPATPTAEAVQPTQAVEPTAVPPTEPAAATEPVATTAPVGPMLQIGETAALGSFLVDEKGMTLYLFTQDSPNTSTCYDACATAWPPLLAASAPVAGAGVDAALLGLAQRSDGANQVTYNGWPLYYFAQDVQPGDTTGQQVKDVWFVISPAGEAVMGAAIGSDPANSNANANDNSNTNADDNSNANTNVNDNSNMNASGSNDNSSVAAGGSVSVDIRGFAFDPSPLRIKVGTTVTWENKDSAPHNVIADNGAFKSGTLREDGKFSFTFTQAGTYPYYCSFHGGPGGQGMSGQVIVEP